MLVINGEVTKSNEESLFGFDPPDRVIKLPNLTLELSRTAEGGWIEKGTMHDDPRGGGGAGHSLAHLAKHYPWVVEQLWRRVIEVEDELRALRKVISYREP